MPTNPHDAFFRATFSHPAAARAQLLAVLPPELAAQLAPDPPTVLDASFVDETLQSSHADVVLMARLQGGEEVVIYCLLEHQSQPDPLMPFRLMGYIHRLWTRWLQDHPGARSLPLVFPVVVYQGGRRWTTPTALSGLVQTPTPGVPYTPAPVELLHQLEDLSAIPEEELTDRALLGLAKLLLRFARSPEGLAHHLPRWRQTWIDAEREGGLRAMQRVMRYIGSMSRPEARHQVRRFIEEVSSENAEDFLSWADWGRQEGRLEGRLEGRRETLRALLALRFGALDPACAARIDRATDAELSRWIAGLLTVASAQELLER